MNARIQSIRWPSLLRGALAVLVVAPASATVHTLTCTLKGVEEVPANTSPGLGTATVSLDDVANTVTVTGSYSGLGSTATLCHIHGPAAVGVGAGIMVNLSVSGGTSGTISSGGSVTPAELADILSGFTYVNVHTTSFPAGELRGQILLEPAGMTSFCSGDGSIATLCPCAPPNTVPSPAAASAHGCANSFDLNGALLKASGSTSPDSVQFLVDIGTNYAGFGVLLMGTSTNPNGATSGDGLLCVSRPTVKFGAHNAGTEGAPIGLWTYPNSVQTTTVSVATSQAPASTSSYQFLYRNAAAGFCTDGTFNASSGVSIPWP